MLTPEEKLAKRRAADVERKRRRRKMYPEKARETKRRYREKNREKILAYERKYRQVNAIKYQEIRERYKDKARMSYRRWKERNPETYKHYAAKKKARRRGAEGSYSLKEWRALLKIYGSKCACCGCDGDMTRDHIIPISKGGTNNIYNIQPLCLSCNSSKHANIRIGTTKNQLCKILG